jgi:YaiO family outer membrane protein
MIRPLAVAAALVLLCTTSGRAADLDAMAREAVARREFAQARTLYGRMVAENPDDLDALTAQARVTSWLHEYDEADALYDRVLARDPTHVDALVGKAYVASWDRRYDEADALLDRAAEVAPDSADVTEARRRNDEAQRWRSIEVGTSRVEVTAGALYEDFSYTDAGMMAFVRGRYRPGRFKYLFEVQQWDKFDETSTRVGGGVSGRITPAWPFALEAWIDPGSDVLPEYDFRAGLGRGLPWRFGAGVEYRLAQFADSLVNIVSGTVEYYFPFPAWATATYHRSFTSSDTAALDRDNDSYSFRYHHQIVPPVIVHVGYAHGVETYEDLSVDEIGRFEADSFEAAVDVAITRRWSVRVGGGYQVRDNDDTVLSMAGALSYHWQ